MDGDAGLLLVRLRDFEQALERHQRAVAEQFARMERDLGRLAPVYSGEAAEHFLARWRRTREMFEVYRDGTADLQRMLVERVDALDEAERGEL